jgi:hypothetical protein
MSQDTITPVDSEAYDSIGGHKHSLAQDTSGQFMFSCKPPGVFSLTDLPRENDGAVKRQIYADANLCGPKSSANVGSKIDPIQQARFRLSCLH